MIKDDIYSIIKQFAGQTNVLTIPKEFIYFTGSRDCALLLSQIIYWTDRTKNQEGWFYKSYKDWDNEICIPEHTLRRMNAKLKKLNIIETKIKKINGNPTLHYRLKIKTFSETFLTYCQKRTLQIVRNENDNLLGSYNTKITNKDYNNIKLHSPEQDSGDKPNKKQLTSKQKNIIKKSKVIVSRLADIIQTNQKINKTSSVSNWVKPIQQLIEKDLNVNNTKIKDRVQRINKALDWYEKNYGGEYVPVIRSGSALKEKFDKLEAAMKRSKPKGNYKEAFDNNDFYKNLPVIEME